MYRIENFIGGKWMAGEGEGQVLYDAVNGEPVGRAGAGGIDFAEALDFGRRKGNRSLRKMSFQERARMLKALALHLREHLEKFYQISYKTGATRADSWIDIEGGIGNLFSYASLRRQLPDEPFLVDGPSAALSKGGTFIGQHIMVPRDGVAVHINAFNFPVWGMLEKIAVNLLAGMPAIVKPATVTCYLTEAVVWEIIASQILPQGALQLICGSAGDLLSHVDERDVISFTGSATTGLKLKSTPTILQNNVAFNMEADSLNCIVLGEDIFPEDPEWELFIKEIKREMTAKAGQKCTAIRRIFAPANRLEDIRIDLGKMLAGTPVGNPRNDKVRMGALAGKTQRQEVFNQVEKLLAASQLVYGSLDSVELIDADYQKGAFMSPLLLLNERPLERLASHEVEAFGPVCTLMPYRDLAEAVELAKKGRGSLVCSLVTKSRTIARDFVMDAGTYHGRILILESSSAKESTGHGSPLPQLIHGGPGRAGGGEEMGGLRGLHHFMQRIALQGSPTMLSAITNRYLPEAQRTEEEKHPFRKYFDEIQPGDSLITHRRTITETDIVNFANISWDHFYAHIDHSSLEGTVFEKPVAHGYFILSAAAGLFVDSKKGPVLLNYGLDDCRFLKPVYAGTTIYVRLTCVQKTAQERREDETQEKGIVKWLVEVFDTADEKVAIANILTLVARKTGAAG